MATFHPDKKEEEVLHLIDEETMEDIKVKAQTERDEMVASG